MQRRLPKAVPLLPQLRSWSHFPTNGLLGPNLPAVGSFPVDIHVPQSGFVQFGISNVITIFLYTEDLLLLSDSSVMKEAYLQLNALYMLAVTIENMKSQLFFR
jgi:hypothetical protein